ncbi:TetR/AcrR family transcriptional regulator [Andreprevotia chitinilytica]|uniref:TetR/AcrR family transcriptional regulator n=1 Tax=Andreprevotia chitinilytica TaxID=396808 RepID=UPI000556B5BF|nr:TetR/AcrR family transcriptional regulator [Andreprevotia chitinilytica]
MPTQIERSAQTQQDLLTAAEMQIAEHGYAALSEGRICARAGVTRGALRHHYPSGRYDLLPMLLEQLIERQSAELAAAGPIDPRERVYLMLYGILNNPAQSNLLVILEIWMATRGDAKLATRINPILTTMFERVFGAAADQNLAPDILAIRLTLTGACMHRLGHDDGHEGVVRAVQWILERLPPPPEFARRFLS